MKTDLDHLPEEKRCELKRVVAIIFAEFEDVLALATQGWKRQGRIMKVILYGSHARGDWVADPVGGYYSDYDILVVVNDERLADEAEYWGKTKDHLLREYDIAKRLSAPVGLAIHSMADMNFQLSRGRPFFVDVVREGIVLYELGTQPFEPPKPLDTGLAHIEAEHHFKQWFASGSEFLGLAKYAMTQGWNNRAAFNLHQATEHFYHATLLVLKLYAPKSHNLNFLRGRAEDVARDLIPIWPRDTKFARRCFELLQQAYVKARYSPHYIIRDVELEWLLQRVELMQAEVKAICDQRLGGVA
ncbi:putative nucleotidyltransferase [Novosphingobium sp. Rr 2-17]|uniref:nucleotidyltransferase and HEPN domain-containing protein n=1 Tax=Novosphingobium sp. Rr 2-17 TaxID=555793 RepID=UPI0002699F06|nr:nucleotidyltransferase and HEPN domain-containing protein [Novosphingobium sp. Rr 2-17]EIZ77989.1 putative nucleotidyltransferase [Novosphingobium sp. Rr 2-17]